MVLHKCRAIAFFFIFTNAFSGFINQLYRYTMNRIIACFLLALVLAGCASSQRMLRKGRYDDAIERSVRRLHRKPDNHDEIRVLERAYLIANEQNAERIRFLQLDGHPRHTPEILQLYNQMKARQSLVRTVLPLHLPERVIAFPYVDYDAEIVQAQRAAAAYYYENALELMQRQDKESYRQAWEELQRVLEYAGNYRDAARLSAEARHLGVSRALVTLNNHSHLQLPPEFVHRLLTVDPRGLDRHWVEFYYQDLDESVDFDYYLVVNLLGISISPDHVSQKDTMVRRSVEDGFEYLLDERGNVRKDSLGNDIRVPRYKDLACTVIESLQRKSAQIEGDLEIIAERPRRLLKREPLVAYTNFEHRSARAVGDLEALDEEMRRRVAVEPTPFPTDAEMILRTSDMMREAIATAIRRNRSLIR